MSLLDANHTSPDLQICIIFQLLINFESLLSFSEVTRACFAEHLSFDIYLHKHAHKCNIRIVYS